MAQTRLPQSFCRPESPLDAQKDGRRISTHLSFACSQFSNACFLLRKSSWDAFNFAASTCHWPCEYAYAPPTSKRTFINPSNACSASAVFSSGTANSTWPRRTAHTRHGTHLEDVSPPGSENGRRYRHTHRLPKMIPSKPHEKENHINTLPFTPNHESETWTTQRGNSGEIKEPPGGRRSARQVCTRKIIVAMPIPRGITLYKMPSCAEYFPRIPPSYAWHCNTWAANNFEDFKRTLQPQTTM